MAEKTIFVVDDDNHIAKLLQMWIEKWGYKVEVMDRGEACMKKMDLEPDLIILDIMLPGISGLEILKEIKKVNEYIPVIMLSAQGQIDIAVECMKVGAFDYLSKPIEDVDLHTSVQNGLKNYELTKEIQNLRQQIQTKYTFDSIIGTDGKMQEVFRLMQKVLDSTITVLIFGESGTGKELIARALHYNSNRKENQFVVVNCAAIPKDLLESELFGHEKGAFTGAYAKKTGKFEHATGGTIFLDEIGEMNFSLQAKLLRVLEGKEFERVGGNETINVDVRIISATNRDLKNAVSEGFFREDLYYRLSAYPIVIPPLRNRSSDILALAESFLKKNNKEFGKEVNGITKEAMKLILGYHWPGNVRELENAIERAIVITDSRSIKPADLPLSIQTATDRIPEMNKQNNHFDFFNPEINKEIVTLESIKNKVIRHAYDICHGNILETSKRLGIGRATLYRLMEKYDIKS